MVRLVPVKPIVRWVMGHRYPAIVRTLFAHRPATNLLPKVISVSLNRERPGFPFDCAGLHGVTWARWAKDDDDVWDCNCDFRFSECWYFPRPRHRRLPVGAQRPRL